METGIVKWYNDAKQFGYAWSNIDGELIILEKWNILEEVKTLKELWTVEFERFDDPEFGLIAKNIKVVSKELADHKFLKGFETNSATKVVRSITPEITVFENALPLEVCNAIIEKHTRDTMNPDSGKQSRQESFAQVTEQVENRGISLGMDPRHYDTLISAIVQYADIPFSHIEAADIYNYETGQFLDLHHDYPYDPRQINYYKHGGDRVGTGIFYLNDDFVGGETKFPKLDISITPKAGSFLYFRQCYDEETNWSTIHESTKILSGTKWIASCFFSDGPRVGYSPRND